MGISQTYTCDCCGQDMPDSSVLSCVIVTRLEDDGQVLQHYFCRAYGCAKSLNKSIASLPGRHESHAEVPPEPTVTQTPVPAPAPQPLASDAASDSASTSTTDDTTEQASTATT